MHGSVSLRRWGILGVISTLSLFWLSACGSTIFTSASNSVRTQGPDVESASAERNDANRPQIGEIPAAGADGIGGADAGSDAGGVDAGGVDAGGVDAGGADAGGDELLQLVLDPSSFTLAQSQTVQLQALATYKTAGVKSVTVDATWTSSDAKVATLKEGGAKGLVEARAAGSVQISATYAQMSAVSALTILDINPDALQIEPAVHRLPLGAGLQYKGTLVFGDTKVDAKSAELTWTSSNSDIAKFDAAKPGYIEALSIGEVEVQATYKGVSANAVLSVVAAQVMAVRLAPSKINLPLGSSYQLEAFAVYSNAQEINVTAASTFVAEPSAVAEFDKNLKGKVIAKQKGDATVKASYLGFVGESNVTVIEASIAALMSEPATVKLPVNGATPITVSAIYTDGTKEIVTDRVSWTIDKSEVAVVLNPGAKDAQIKGLGLGTAIVRATLGTTFTEIPVEISEATLVRIDIEPATVEVQERGAKQLAAKAYYSNAAVIDVTKQAVWKSDNENVATVANVSNNSGGANTTIGLLHAKDLAGKPNALTSVSATYNGKSGSATVRVIPRLAPSADLKVNGQDGLVTLPASSDLQLSWTTANVTLCKVIYNLQIIAETTSGSIARKAVAGSGQAILACANDVPPSLADPVKDQIADAVQVLGTSPQVELRLDGRSGSVSAPAGKKGAVLSWVVNYASTCALNFGGQDLPPAVAAAPGNRAVDLPSETGRYEYKLACVDAKGNRAESVIVLTTTKPIVSLYVDEKNVDTLSVAKGQRVKVRYVADYAEYCSIYFNGAKQETFANNSQVTIDTPTEIKVLCKDAALNEGSDATKLETTLPSVVLSINGDASASQKYGKNQQVAVSFVANNVDNCELSAGAAVLGKSSPVNYLVTSNVTIRVTCFDLAPNKAEYAIAVEAVLPMVDLKVDGSDGPVPMVVGKPFQAAWTSANTASCALYNGSAKIADVSPYSSTMGTANLKLTVRCVDAVTPMPNEALDSVDVIATNAAISLFANGKEGALQVEKKTPVSLTWTLAGVKNCKLKQGSQEISMATNKYDFDAQIDQNFDLDCIEDGPLARTLRKSVAVKVTTPVVTLRVNGESVDNKAVNHNEKVTLSWAALYSKSCELFEGSTKRAFTNDSFEWTVTATTVWKVVCVDNNGNLGEDQVTIQDVPIIIKIELSVSRESSSWDGFIPYLGERQYYVFKVLSDNTKQRIDGNGVTFSSDKPNVISMTAAGLGKGLVLGQPAKVKVLFQSFSDEQVVIVKEYEASQSFDIEANKGKLDLVWVIDNSPSMKEEIGLIRTTVLDFLRDIEGFSDLKFLLLSLQAADGLYEPVQMPAGFASANRKQVNGLIHSKFGLTGAAVAICAQESNRLIRSEAYDYQICNLNGIQIAGPSDQHKYYPGMNGALTPEFRPGAKKAFVFITDDKMAEPSDYPNSTNPTMIHDGNFLELIVPHVGDRRPFVFGITGVQKRPGCAIVNEGKQLERLAARSSGVIFDICDAESSEGWNQHFTDLAEKLLVIANSDFTLPHEKILRVVSVKQGDADIPKAATGSAEVIGWSLIGNKLSIDPDALDPKGGAVKIVYTYAP